MTITRRPVGDAIACDTVLPEMEKGQGWFLSCQAQPLGDISVELTRANGYRPPSAWRRLLATTGI